MDLKTGNRESEAVAVLPSRRLRWIIAASFALAALVYTFGILFGRIPEENRLDGAALTVLGFAALIVAALLKPKIFSRFRVVEAAGVKFELWDIKEKQAQQAEQLQQVALLLPLVLPATERRHLVNLVRGHTAGYKGNSWLQNELRRLRSIGLIASIQDRRIADLGEGSEFNLADYVKLTDLGHQWVQRINELKDIEGADGP